MPGCSPEYVTDRTSRPKSLAAGHFYGSNVSSTELAGFRLSETVYPAGMKVPVHFHELPYFCLLVGGGYWERYGSKRVEFDPGSIVFHPAGQVHHGDIHPEPTRCFHFEIDRSWIERLGEHGGLPGDSIEYASGPLAWLAARMFAEYQDDRSASSLMIEALGLEMLGLLLREATTPDTRAPRWIEQATARLHQEFARSQTVAEIADDLNISAVRLSRGFRRWKGQSIGSYRRQLRVEHVARRLADSDDRLADLAAEAGFSDQSHMTRIFKRATGLTPHRYRRLIT